MDFLLNVGIDVSTSTAQFRADLETIVSELAKTPPKIKVALAADQKSIENLRAQIASIINQLTGTGISTGTVNTSNITSAANEARNSAAAHNADTTAKKASAAASKEVTNAANAEAQAAKKVADAEKQVSSAATSNGALLNRYATQIKKAEQGLQKWTRAEKSRHQSSRDAYASLNSITAATKMYYEQFRGGKISSDEFNAKLQELNDTYNRSESVIRNNGDATKTWGERLGGLAKKFTQWFGVSQIIMQAYRTIKKMISISVELESAFAQLKIVTGATDAEMKRFKETAIDLAKSVGQSVTDVTKSIETFSRLGYNLQDSATLAKYASILSNTAAVSTEEATTGLTSIIKGFGMDVENSEHVADVLIEVGQKYAVSAGEMMVAYEKSGAALNATNTSFEKSAGLIAAANAAVQDSSVVGRSCPVSQ